MIRNVYEVFVYAPTNIVSWLVENVPLLSRPRVIVLQAMVGFIGNFSSIMVLKLEMQNRKMLQMCHADPLPFKFRLIVFSGLL